MKTIKVYLSKEEDFTTIFKLFLKKNHLTQQFLDNYNAYNNKAVQSIDEYIARNGVDFLSFESTRLFCLWSQTEEGGTFWCLVSNVWKIIFHYRRNNNSISISYLKELLEDLNVCGQIPEREALTPKDTQICIYLLKHIITFFEKII